MFISSPALKSYAAVRPPAITVILLLLLSGALLNCTSKVQEKGQENSPLKLPGLNQEERTPVVKYDERGRIKGLFGLRTDPSGDPTCRLREYTVDFVNIERNEYLVFQLPNDFRVWVKLEGEMQKMLTDVKDAKAQEFLSKWKKYKLTAYLCDGIGHNSYETVSVELLN